MIAIYPTVHILLRQQYPAVAFYFRQHGETNLLTSWPRLPCDRKNFGRRLLFTCSLDVKCTLVRHHDVQRNGFFTWEQQWDDSFLFIIMLQEVALKYQSPRMPFIHICTVHTVQFVELIRHFEVLLTRCLTAHLMFGKTSYRMNTRDKPLRNENRNAEYVISGLPARAWTDVNVQYMYMCV